MLGQTSIRSKYTLYQEIGRGAFGITYKVQELSTNKIYCFKEMSLPFHINYYYNFIITIIIIIKS